MVSVSVSVLQDGQEISVILILTTVTPIHVTAMETAQ